MSNCARILASLLLIKLLSTGAFAAPPVKKPASTAQAADLEFFEKKIRPLLVDNCFTCHSANTNSRGGLRVDDRNGLLAGGDGGPAIVPGHPEKSRLLLAVSYTDKKLKMPPGKPLSEEQVALLKEWIEKGAAWPSVEIPEDLGTSETYYQSLREGHWAWKPQRKTPVPKVKDAAWARDDLDRFVLEKLESRNLKPVGDADRTTLIRRLSFDLTGLPPTPEEIDAFLADQSPKAVETLVDRLLASPAYGERWGRHWLDVARFGESTGSSRNVPYPHAWRYRDYVLNAFNKDKPYDRFLQEQIAGDLLPASSQEERDELTVATGFLALGVKDVNQRFKVRFIMDNVDEQIDTVSRAVLALTASCARCHDHKFDPIPAADYYALAGIFTSTDLCAGVRNKMGGGGLDYYDTSLLLPLAGGPKTDTDTPKKSAEAKAALDEARKELTALQSSPKKKNVNKMNDPDIKAARATVTKRQNELAALSDPANQGPIALGVREGKAIADTGIRIRGEAEQIGPVVPRGFLSALSFPGQPKVGAEESGRRELAQWLTDKKNPLTSRVMVNRIWRHLFGQGIVTSVDNFGTTGAEPTHPELLDHLSFRFMDDGWSVKRLIRAIVLSRSYQLSSQSSEAQAAVDPANQLLWRHNPRRMDAEELRDAMLAAAGQLDLTPLDGSAAMSMRVIELSNTSAEAKRLEDEARASVRRSVYLPLVRGVMPTSLAVFDFAEQGMVTGSRDVTTVAPQALYMLNDPFVRQQSLQLVERVAGGKSADDSDRLRELYRLTLGREPTTAEVSRAIAYLSDYQSATGGGSTTETSDVADAGLAANDNGDESSSSTESGPKTPKKKGQRRGKAANRSIDPATAAWATYSQALFGSAEFRYVR